MEDFSEISAGLLQAGGALPVSSSAELATRIKGLLGDPDRAERMGRKAGTFVCQSRGVVSRHLQVIDQLLGKRASRK
jgi:3-deoxy-D-manno-octulosonic-acid transferase